jgi:hypothetical protein
MEMERSGSKDPKLSEVKAVLQRLQRISADRESRTHHPQTAQPRVQHSRRLAVMSLLGLASAVLVLIGGLSVTGLIGPIGPAGDRAIQPPVAAPREGKPSGAPVEHSTLVPPAVPPASLPRPALEAALGLLSAGRVKAARAQLLKLAPGDSAEVAWALARSYDPNFLRTVPAADAGPDVPEATRWYRSWHAAAVKQGLVTHNTPLDRIIESMR